MTTSQDAADNPQDRLGAAVRALADGVARTGACDDDLRSAAELIERLARDLGLHPPARAVHNSPYHAMSLVGGSAHPFAPQLHTVASGDGVHGTVTLGPAFEGGPGLVHGGVLSLLFDHAMGQAIFHAGRAAMTVSLAIAYRAPTPLLAPLAVDARVERTDGRKLFVSARVSTGGNVTAEATGVFVALTAANVAQIFPADRIPRGHTDHVPH